MSADDLISASPSRRRRGNRPLTEEMLRKGACELAARDVDLARILEHLGTPPLWAREPGFPTLVHIILEQQVSLASARAAFNRLLDAASPLTPQRFLTLDDVTLKAIGFSRQKVGYSRALAESIVQGRLNLETLGAMNDAAVRAALVQLRGIGPWTADIYLLMALRRRDAWPSGDLALAIAVQRVKGLVDRPSPDQLEMMSKAWRPWRWRRGCSGTIT